MNVEIKKRDSKGFAIANDGDKRAGLMTYLINDPKHITINHTEVEPEYEGHTVGKELLMKIVEMARDEDIKIIPQCPFAEKLFKRNVKIQDVLYK